MQLRILISFLILVSFYNLCPGKSISGPPEIEVKRCFVGKKDRFKREKSYLWVKNKGGAEITLEAKPVFPEERFLRENYDILPNLKYIKVKKNIFTLASGEKRQIEVIVHIPKKKTHLSKNYQVNFDISEVPSHKGSAISACPGIESVVLITTKEQIYRTEISIFIDGKGGNISDDGIMSLSVPVGALKKGAQIGIFELLGNEIPYSGNLSDPVGAFRFTPKGLMFRKPVKLSIYYCDNDDDGIIDDTEFDETKLNVFYFNGFEWEFIGGEVDTENNVISVDIFHFSVYGLFPAGSPAKESYQPTTKIITPARRDGINDFILFPGLQGDYKINIYDIAGLPVKTLKNKNIWHGNDENGNMVESGTYIYYYNVDISGQNTVISGVVVVAK